MSFCDIVQSLKTGKRLFLWTGQGSAESLHHFPSHQTSQQKKKKVQLPSLCWPLKCVSKGNVKMNDIRVDMAQYSTHLRGRGFIVWRQKLTLILTHQGKLSHNHMRLKNLYPTKILIPCHSGYTCYQYIMRLTAKVYLKSCLLGCYWFCLCVTWRTGQESLLLTASIKPTVI